MGGGANLPKRLCELLYFIVRRKSEKPKNVDVNKNMDKRVPYMGGITKYY